MIPLREYKLDDYNFYSSLRKKDRDDFSLQKDQDQFDFNQPVLKKRGFSDRISHISKINDGEDEKVEEVGEVEEIEEAKKSKSKVPKI